MAETVVARAVALALQGVRPLRIARMLSCKPQTAASALWKARKAGVPLPLFAPGREAAPPVAKPPRPPSLAERALPLAREGMSLAEIAATLGTTKATATESLRKARLAGESVPVFPDGRPRRGG